MLEGLPKRKVLRRADQDSANGIYFITICSRNKSNYFGRIVNKEHQLNGRNYDERFNEMMLNENGLVIQSMLGRIEVRYDNVSLKSFCIMPNHAHFIIAITSKPTYESPEQRQPLLPKMIGYLKMNTAKQIRLLNPAIPCVWQRGFYDHIIRNDMEHQAIKQYIETNHQRWFADIFFSQENGDIIAHE